MPDPALVFANDFISTGLPPDLATKRDSGNLTASRHIIINRPGTDMPIVPGYSLDTIYVHQSPALDSIIYWFMKKSINLYGEALIKTFAFKKNGQGLTEKGVELIQNFWKERGIAPTELNIVDGSGLSPLNRVTTHAQVSILQYAKKQFWFSGFYDALPEFNGMKMKSGTISGVKAFCGYQKSKDGNEYIFSFLVNNYNGSSSTLVQKMYKVLDELK
jgi:D-alanyl-D-alanine carboxypeptidase/D-alanyl-D-alanine-endopeptidase (penicillin-binding protein 4)